MVDVSKYKKLTDFQHIRLRPDTYAGQISVECKDTWVIENGKVVWRSVSYSPAFLKFFDEIITNSADFSKKTEGKHLNRIDITLSKLTGEITVQDNGGIPVVKHPEYKQWLPSMIFGELRTGSNYDDSEVRSGGGRNGIGAKLTMVFSESFRVETADGKKKYERTYLNGGESASDELITDSRQKFTRISFIPDYKHLGLTLDDDHYAMLVRRVYEIAATNLHLSIFLNSKKLDFKTFGDFVDLFNISSISIGDERLQAYVFHSKDGFKQISYVNSLATFQGGTHIQYVMGKVVESIRAYIQKKTKQDIKPSDIQNHFFLMVNAVIDNPAFSGQTKETLSTPVKDYGFNYELDQKSINKILKSDIVIEIIEWAQNKQKLEEMRALKDRNKEFNKTNLKSIDKYEPATEKVDRSKCILFLCEGDSAANPLVSARDPKIHGVFPLKGKMINVRDVSKAILLNNEELKNLMLILGLQFGETPDIKKLRYGSIAGAMDQDLDGHHCFGLLLNAINELWPGLIEQGFIKRLNTPIVRVKQGKQVFEFFSEEEFEEWAKDKKSLEIKYLKGLGSNETSDFKRYMFEDKYFETMKIETDKDKDALGIAFDKKRANDRKVFLYG
jgi:DNA topoisomerase-2